MNIIHDLNDPAIQRPTVLTIGVFDGLHLGHQAIVRRVVERALLIDATPTLITFDPHPRQVLKPETAPPLLQTFAQKMEGLKLLGMQQVVVMNFTHELAALSAEEFIGRFMLEALGAREIHLGKGFAFGKDRRGNIELLRREAERLGFVADEVPEVRLQHHRISSTMVRRLLQSGRVNLGRRMLGRPYGIEGTVIEGRKLGRTISFPTANIAVENRVVPADGVYITLALIDGVWHRSVTNIGKRPTVGLDVESKVETFVLDFDKDLYGKTIRIRFLHRLRGEKKFAGLDELKTQIARDCETATRYFETAAAQRNFSFI
ncbi:MAG: bifunctional riboflavin kinase/FAD synthetase [Acidobacteria bacterium]|nr:bifunctional riboflavin kinase/FAD synthetase [Acidobacteriota bacterium]